MHDIHFSGLTAPLRLVEADAVLPVLKDALPGWPFEQRRADLAAQPFFTITGTSDTPLLRCDCHVEDRPVCWYDAVNSVCDVISALAMALPSERPDLICLHAAGVAMAGRLVVFPNVRRAGKSILSAALARAGYPVFSDDVVPVAFDAAAGAVGVAMGAMPRLRLPLPEAVGSDFRDWVVRHRGPGNRQYQYLALENPVAHGEMLPVGAFVILERQDRVAARLDPVAPDAAMDALLHQNFTRDRHSAEILQNMVDTLASRPVFRLTFADPDDAVAVLAEAFSAWSGAGPVPADGTHARFRTSDAAPAVRPVMHRLTRFRQRPGSLTKVLGQTMYLADVEGRAIHRMDPIGAAIWTVIEEPATADDIVGLLAEAFPDAQPADIAADVDRLLRRLYLRGLIQAEA